MDREFRRKERSQYDKKALHIRRVAKVTKGGKRLRFSTVVVAGDRKGSVGVALGRGADVRSAIEQGERLATKAIKKIELVGDTIPHEINYKYGAARVLLRPARPGTGVIAGSSVRVVLEMAGVDNVYGKILGSNEPNANAYCTFKALQELKKDRVLRKMRNMRERIVLKEEMDKERQIKEDKKRKEKRKQKMTNKGKGRTTGKRGNRKPSKSKVTKKE